MKTIKLQKLAPINLNTVFARDMGGNKFKHYTFTLAQCQYGSQKLTVEERLQAKISEEEGEPVTVEIVKPSYSGYDRGRAIHVEDVTDIVLANDQDIKDSLLAKEVRSLVYQYNINRDHWKSKYLTPINTFLNTFIYKINGVLRTLFCIDPFRYEDDLSPMENKRNFREWLYDTTAIRPLPCWGETRQVSPLTYLSVAFEDGEQEIAAAALLADLRILQNKKMIIGHLCMPSMIAMVDPIGTGKTNFSIFCFVVADYDKLRAETKLPAMELPQRPFQLIGLKYENHEGDVKYVNGSPEERYQVEQVYVDGNPADINHEINCQSYAALVDALKDLIANDGKFSK